MSNNIFPGFPCLLFTDQNGKFQKFFKQNRF